MEIKEITSKSALHKLKRKGLPYKYDLNIYRGCTHNCQYCYAAKSHKYISNNSFNEEVFVKGNIADLLEQELSSPAWSGDIINIGGVCDSYQAVEDKYRLMRDVLKVMIKHRKPVIISTKSDLILRDIDLIDELAQHTYVNIAVSITSCDDNISKRVEPGASLPASRVNILKEFSETKAYTGFHLMPILPYLADSEDSLEQLVKWAAEVRVSYMLSGMLYLTGGIKKRYYEFINKYFPAYLADYNDLYPGGGAKKEYKNRVHSFLAELRGNYGVNNQYSKFIKERL